MIKSFAASLDQLYEMLQFVREQSLLAGFESSYIAKIELATEEALVNIISYGYVNRLGTIEIDCSPSELQAGVKIVIKDRGVPYNPLTNAKYYDIESPLESKSVGGYGVYFILKIMDEVEYRRESNENLLLLTKYL